MPNQFDYLRGLTGVTPPTKAEDKLQTLAINSNKKKQDLQFKSATLGPRCS